MDTEIIELKIVSLEGDIIRLMKLKHIVERLHVRFGLSTAQIGIQLRLNERSVKKIMQMQFTKELSEI